MHPFDWGASPLAGRGGADADSGGFRMAHIINDDCVSCGACADECPEDAISEGDDRYVIDAGLCTDCGTCVDVCPAEAILPGE